MTDIYCVMYYKQTLQKLKISKYAVATGFEPVSMILYHALPIKLHNSANMQYIAHNKIYVIIL